MQLPPANTFDAFDWFLIFVLVLSTIMAFVRGIIRALFSFVGFIIGILVASWNFPAVAAHLSNVITSVAAAEIVSFVLILTVVVLLFHLAAALLQRTVKAVGLGFVDRFLGAIFGFFRGCLFGVAAMMSVAAFVPRSPWIQNSVLAPYFLTGAHAVSFVVPDRFQARIAEGATHLLHQTPDSLKAHTLRSPGDRPSNHSIE
jgi:membrane protein required for colicin V production